LWEKKVNVTTKEKNMIANILFGATIGSLAFCVGYKLLTKKPGDVWFVPTMCFIGWIAMKLFGG